MEHLENDYCEIEATVASGLEKVAAEDISEKLGVDVTTARGKLSFTISLADVRKITALSCIDNLYVIIKRYHDFPFDADLEGSLSQLRQIVPEVDWSKGIGVWSIFSNFPSQVPLKPRVCAKYLASDHNIPECPNCTQAQNDLLTVTGNADQISSDSATHVSLGNDTSQDAKVSTTCLDRLSNASHQEALSNTPFQTPSINAIHQDATCHYVADNAVHVDMSDSTYCQDALKDVTHQDISQITSDEKLKKIIESATVSDVGYAKRELSNVNIADTTELTDTLPDKTVHDEIHMVSNSSGDDQNTLSVDKGSKKVRNGKKSLDRSNFDKSRLCSFRVTCYRTGSGHPFQSPQAAFHFGGSVQDYFGWKVDLDHYDLEVILTVEGREVYVSLALTSESLHRRNIIDFGHTTLRPTIAYNMLRLCNIQPGEVVCDPMCGSGTIPLEAALNWPMAHHLCGDFAEICTRKTYRNLENVNRKRISKGRLEISLDIIGWSGASLPLKDGSVDVFITDMPFGKRSGSKLANWKLYPAVLADMARVAKVNTGRACLLTQDRKCLIKVLRSLSLWRRGPTIQVNIGGLAAGIFILYRTGCQASSGMPAKSTTAQDSGEPCSGDMVAPSLSDDLTK